MNICISAVEPSGDQMGADLHRALQKRSSIKSFGICGPQMRAAGVREVAPMEAINAMGIAEALAKAPSILRARRTLKKAISPDTTAVIGIDGPDFHLPLLQNLKDCFRIGLVSPQIWAWRPKRAQGVARGLDLLLCLFDFEPALYPSEFDARFIGHPAVDRVKPSPNRQDGIFGLAPGSRPQETKRMWPIFLETAKILRAQDTNRSFVVAAPVIIPKECPWIKKTTSGAMAYRRTQATLTKSGTITLELALMGTPMVIAHQVHPLTHWISKQKITGIDHIALPNILTKERIAPEFRQHLDPVELAKALTSVNQQNFDLKSAGDGGAIDRAADAIIERIRTKR